MGVITAQEASSIVWARRGRRIFRQRFIDQLHAQGVKVVGCTANLTWDDTLESIENFEQVKSRRTRSHHAYCCAAR